MENITLTLKTKQVGNSLAVFIPAKVKEQLDLGPNQEVIAHLQKKKRKNKKNILEMFGILKGEKITWRCEDDRKDRD